MASLRAIVLLFLTVSLSHAGDLTTFDGKKTSGELLSADAKEVVLKTSVGNESFEPSKVSTIDFRPTLEPAQGAAWIEVQLVDGSLFHCSEFRIKGKQVLLTLAAAGKEKPITIAAPMSTLLYMIRNYQDPKIAQQFRALLSKRGKRDIYIIINGEALDRVDGTFGDGDEKGEKVAFERESGLKSSIGFKFLAGMIMNPPPGEIAQTLCRVVDVNRNEVYVRSIATAPDQKLTLVSSSGVSIDYPSAESIAKIDFSAGALRFLSDLEPKKVEETDYHFSRDRSLNGTELKLGEQLYRKGLAIHAHAVLTYDVEGKYKTFEAVAGVDGSVNTPENLGDITVILTIEGDNKVLYKQKIQKADAVRAVSLNVLGVKTLRITVESEGLLDIGNQIDLADAKLRK